MNEAQTEERTNSERALLRTVHCALCVYEGYSDRCTVHAQGTRYTLHSTGGHTRRLGVLVPKTLF
jgi:hypothetical protein